MSTTPQQTIITLLNLIDYQDNKEEFADQFISLCLQQAFFKSVATLNVEEKALLTKAIKDTPNINDQIVILKQYISEDLFTNNLTTVSQELLMDYINDISSSLTVAQQQHIDEFLKKLETSQLSSS